MWAASVGAQQLPDVDGAAVRIDSGRFTLVAFPQDERLARSLLASAQRNDTFPGLPTPRDRILIAIAPDAARFRAWVGSSAPEWGIAIAIPSQRRIVMQGSYAGSDAGDPLVVLRHELAHLALHEYLGELTPRWFDEGYASVAAREWSREQAFETSFALVWRTLPSYEELDDGFYAGSARAGWSYALAHRVVSELAGLGGEPGLANFFRYWKESASFEVALRQAYGMTGEQFDRHWQRQTRRRYGVLALVTNVSLFVGVLVVLFGPLFVMRRRRDRRRLQAMRDAEAAQERAARESALAMVLALSAATSQGEQAVEPSEKDEKPPDDAPRS